MRFSIVFFCTLLGLLSIAYSGERQAPFVFAAASLTAPLTEIGKLYEEQTGQNIRFSFAGSSTLAKQIVAGAEIGLYFSANRAWVDYLEAKGLLKVGDAKVLFTSSLVVIRPTDSVRGEYPRSLKDLSLWLESGRLAIGDPDHVPAGIYAKEAMVSAGVWANLRSVALPQPNVKSALALVMRGEAAAGIVYRSDILNVPQVRELFEIEPALHSPIQYVAVRLGRYYSENHAKFYGFLETESAQAVFKKYGFLPVP